MKTYLEDFEFQLYKFGKGEDLNEIVIEQHSYSFTGNDFSLSNVLQNLHIHMYIYIYIYVSAAT